MYIYQISKQNKWNKDIKIQNFIKMDRKIIFNIKALLHPLDQK
jgi:hypothetical protein